MYEIRPVTFNFEVRWLIFECYWLFWMLLMIFIWCSSIEGLHIFLRHAMACFDDLHLMCIIEGLHIFSWHAVACFDDLHLNVNFECYGPSARESIREHFWTLCAILNVTDIVRANRFAKIFERYAQFWMLQAPHQFERYAQFWMLQAPHI